MKVTTTYNAAVVAALALTGQPVDAFWRSKSSIFKMCYNEYPADIFSVSCGVIQTARIVRLVSKLSFECHPDTILGSSC